MNKTVISTFTFGIFLLVIGAVSQFFDWKQAPLLMGIGVLFETLAVLIFAYNKIKKK
ncbi:hypothetical protein [Aureivirga sp. CE67]|uniref:hypothetical protein n=1 Tax=Aureivirga sp. CE67 TaxID=1788983 RepID=UPI0018CB5307|nr:hypothetical protein [Aureivirga sp. CE67]